VELIDEALPDQARAKALARGGSDRQTSLLLPSQANWFWVSSASSVIFIRPPGVDKADEGERI
jgi:hypothetical protein